MPRIVHATNCPRRIVRTTNCPVTGLMNGNEQDLSDPPNKEDSEVQQLRRSDDRGSGSTIYERRNSKQADSATTSTT